jgi:type IV pilus assembly protein PilX
MHARAHMGMGMGPRLGGRQRGAVLVIGLVLLMVITLLSVGGLRGTGMQERMASNLRDRNLAFQSAESALRAAEALLIAGTATGSTAVSDPGDLGFWESCWAGTAVGCPPAVEHTVDIATWGIDAAPEYRMERLRAGNYGSLAADEAMASPPLYRITVRAVGGTQDSVVLLQSTFRP